MPTEVPFKEWLYQMMMRFNVSDKTIWRWRKVGKLVGPTFRYFNRKVVFVSGETKTQNLNYIRRYDFSSVDWSKANCEIARAIGCHPSLVRVRRKQWMQTA